MTTLPPDPQNPTPPTTPVPPIGYQPPPTQQPPAYQPPAYAQDPAAAQQPGYPPQGHGQQPPAPPTPPQRKGLPAWAWVLISVAALFFIGVIVAIAVFVPRFINATASGPLPIPAVPAPAPAPTEKLEIGEAPSGTVYTMDDQVDFSAGPFWNVTFEGDWDIDIFDVDGVNQMTNLAAGCTFYTFQGFGPLEAADATDDREATELTIPTALQMGLPWAASDDPVVLPDGERLVEYDFGAAEVAMQQVRATYTGADGKPRERLLLLRAFTPGSNALLAQVDCPAGSPELEARLDGLAITQF